MRSLGAEDCHLAKLMTAGMNVVARSGGKKKHRLTKSYIKDLAKQSREREKKLQQTLSDCMTRVDGFRLHFRVIMHLANLFFIFVKIYIFLFCCRCT
jgi:hypothetical protein